MTGFIRDFFSNTDDIIRVGGLLLVLLMMYLETGVFLGMILPGGDYMLFATGIFCGCDFFGLSLFLVILFILIAAVSGDSTGFIQGRWLGKRLFLKGNSRIFKREYLIRSNLFYERYGVWAFIMGRFVPIVRTFLPMIAGASGFRFQKFLLYDAIGGTIWVSTIISIGYFFGRKFPEVINYSVYILLAIVILASIVILKLVAHKNK
ncbi:MAG: DedA family protein [Bacteroidota bacterium]|nr:DedA family protein [Bacteroidota bacterium]